MWRQWWIGDKVRQVPPLRFLEYIDIKHLNEVALDETEMHGRRGADADKRRDVSKALSDMKFLMKYIKEKVEQRNAYIGVAANVTIAGVDRMFGAVSDLFIERDRDVQKQWISLVRHFR